MNCPTLGPPHHGAACFTVGCPCCIYTERRGAIERLQTDAANDRDVMAVVAYEHQLTALAKGHEAWAAPIAEPLHARREAAAVLASARAAYSDAETALGHAEWEVTTARAKRDEARRARLAAEAEVKRLEEEASHG